MAAAQPLLVHLLKLASLINRPMQEGVAGPAGLSLNELRIMMCLHGEGPCAGHEITILMGIPPMNVSRAVASLGARGWVEPAADPANRRRRPVRLSAAGVAACAALAPDLDHVARHALGSLSAGDMAALDRIATGLIGRLERWPSTRKPVPEDG